MARFAPKVARPSLSVLDRLLVKDEGAARVSDVPVTDTQISERRGGAVRSFGEDPAQSLARVRAGLLRDVSLLLNARQGFSPGQEPPDGDPRRALLHTVARFGLPDISTLDLRHDASREILRRELSVAFERFEPRLRDVEVDVGEPESPEGRTRFRVRATLALEPEPVDLSFDAMVRWRHRDIEIHGEEHD